MKKHWISLILILMVLAFCTACSKAEKNYEATYLGVKDWKMVPRETVLSSKEAVYQFDIDGEINCFCVNCTEEDYSIQNILMEGYDYTICVKDNTVMSAELLDSGALEGDVEGYVPGERTVKNFLMTSLAPLGRTIYVYGGGWNFQDDGSSIMATTIGVSPTWEKFYQTTDVNYDNERDTCPTNGWNNYYYAGLDCSAYIGWVLYNTMNTESASGSGFVTSSSKIARTLAEDYGYGTWNHYDGATLSEEYFRTVSKQLKPGDIVSMDGHCYIVIGTCKDDSVVIINSTATDSVTGNLGGGPQLSAISMKGTNDLSCEAYQLACQYMEKYYPEWTEKYPAVMTNVNSYFYFPDENENTGVLTWNIDETGLEDPDHMRDMDAASVLKSLFAE